MLMSPLLSWVLYYVGVEYDRIAVVVVVGRVAAVASCVGDTCVVIDIYYIVAVVIMYVVVDYYRCSVVVVCVYISGVVATVINIVVI